MNETRKCARCGAELPAELPEEQCPKCMLHVGLGTQAPTNQNQASEPKSPPPPPPSPSELAKFFPQLEILEVIGQGGMGIVYKARQPRLDRIVALKILPLNTANDPVFNERFCQEARALARLSHPHIVAIYDFGQTDGLSYLIMEYVDGASLRQLERAGGITPREALKIIPVICDALQFAHDQGIVHRDIKPENILIDKTGRVKIADFGLAKLLGRKAPETSLTQAREIMGTPTYMAPEQMERPLEVDHRADIYSVGVVFYEMLTGELPIGKFASPSQKVEVDVRLDHIVLRALEKERERRYQQASEVKTDVETVTRTSTQPPARGLPASERSTALSPDQSARRWFFRTATAFLIGIGLLFVLIVGAGALFLAMPALQRAWAQQRVTQADGANATVLKSFPADSPTISADLLATNGSWSITTADGKVVRLFEIPNPGPDQGTLIYRASMRSENLNGRAYLEMWCRFPGKGEFFSRALANPITGTTDWASFQTPFFLKSGEKPDLIRLNVVIEGSGSIWIRDVSLAHATTK